MPCMCIMDFDHMHPTALSYLVSLLLNSFCLTTHPLPFRTGFCALLSLIRAACKSTGVRLLTGA